MARSNATAVQTVGEAIAIAGRELKTRISAGERVTRDIASLRQLLTTLEVMIELEPPIEPAEPDPTPTPPV